MWAYGTHGRTKSVLTHLNARRSPDAAREPPSIMIERSPSKEEWGLCDHRLAPHELLDGEARDCKHRKPPVEELVGPQLPLAVGALLLRDAEWIEPVVAREALLNGSEPRPLVGVLLRDVLQVGCETGSEDQEKRGGAVEQPTIE
jgi:hypothetical protein